MAEPVPEASKATAAAEDVVEDGTPYKGKPSSFFILKQLEQPDPSNPHGLELNDEQWAFIFKHYPMCAGDPVPWMIQLYGMAAEKE